jgi:molybdopterin-guanine dinucleotide biosynthesis protein A
MSKGPPIFGLVLAGGQSRRFGCDKAAEQYQGQALLERSVAALGAGLDEVFVSVRADQTQDRLRSRFELIVDREEGLGPAGGILAAHGEYPDVAWLVLACDLPNVDEAAVAGLLNARDAGKAATAYRSPFNGGPEPLCAIYEPDTLARFRHGAGSGGEFSPRSFLAGENVELIEAAGTQTLSNVNTPDELARLEAEKRRGCA